LPPLSTVVAGSKDVHSPVGPVSSHYFDKYLFEGDPELLREVVAHAIPLIPAAPRSSPLELGGVPFATRSRSRRTRGRVRPQGGQDLRDREARRGSRGRRRRLLVVEDVITTGGQVVMSAGDLRRLGAIVGHSSVSSTGATGPRRLRAAGLSLSAVFTAADLDEAAAPLPEPPL